MFFWGIWLDSVALTLADSQKPSDKCPLLSPQGRAPSHSGRVGFLHRGLPHPAQCDTPGTEVEARVIEEELRRIQEEVVLGPGGFPVLGCLRVYLVSTDGVEEHLEGPSFSLPVPVEVGA